MRGLITLAALVVVALSTAAKAETLMESDRTCVTEQFIWLENEGYAKTESYDEIAKRALENCGWHWRAGIYRPIYEYALKDFELRDIDDRKRAQYAAAEKARIAKAEKAAKDAEAMQRLINDCADAQVGARWSAPGGHGKYHEKYAFEAVKECWTWPANATENELFANQSFVAAYNHALEYRPNLDWDTLIAESQWRKAHGVPFPSEAGPDAKRNPDGVNGAAFGKLIADQSLKTAKTESRPLSFVDYALVAFLAFGVVTTLRDIIEKRRERRDQRRQVVETVDLRPAEWRKARIEPRFDVRPDSPWSSHNV